MADCRVGSAERAHTTGSPPKLEGMSSGHLTKGPEEADFYRSVHSVHRPPKGGGGKGAVDSSVQPLELGPDAPQPLEEPEGVPRGKAAVCGDGKRTHTEGCEDGNLNDGEALPRVIAAGWLASAH